MAKQVRYIARRQFTNHGQLIERGQEVPQAARWLPAVRDHYCLVVEVVEPAQGGIMTGATMERIGDGPEMVVPLKGRATGNVVEPGPAEPEPDLAPEHEPEGAEEAALKAAEPQMNSVSLSGVAKARGGTQTGRPPAPASEPKAERRGRRGE